MSDYQNDPATLYNLFTYSRIFFEYFWSRTVKKKAIFLIISSIFEVSQLFSSSNGHLCSCLGLIFIFLKVNHRSFYKRRNCCQKLGVLPKISWPFQLILFSHLFLQWNHLFFVSLFLESTWLWKNYLENLGSFEYFSKAGD